MNRITGGVLCLAALVGTWAWAEEGAGASGAKADMQALKAKHEEVRKSLRDLQQRLQIDQDQEVAGLRMAMDEARKAYDSKVREKLAADPEGAKLIQEMEQIREQIKGAAVRGQGEKPERGAKKEKTTAAAP